MRKGQVINHVKDRGFRTVWGQVKLYPCKKSVWLGGGGACTKYFGSVLTQSLMFSRGWGGGGAVKAFPPFRKVGGGEGHYFTLFQGRPQKVSAL